MKNRKRLLLSAVLAVCLVLTIVTTAFAEGDVPDPTVKRNVSDTVYAYDIIAMTDLPGIVNTGTDKIVPEGLDSSKQFEGSGVKIYDITTTDKVTVCFAITNYQQGWTGKVYKWYGGKWIAQHSTLVKPKSEDNVYHVCNPYATNGTYALVVSYSAK